MNPIQVILTIFLLGILTRLLSLVRAGQMSWRRAVLWAALWLAGAIVVWFPNTAQAFASLAGVKRGVDAVLYVTVLLLTYLVFRLYAALERQDQTITRLVSEIALMHGPAPTSPSGPRRPSGDEPAEGE